jgi:hypothetical protein
MIGLAEKLASKKITVDDLYVERDNHMKAYKVAGFRGRRPAAMKRPGAATEASIASEAVVTEPLIGLTKRPASKSSSGPSKKAARVVAVLTLPAEDLEAPVTPPSRKATTKPSGLDRFLKEMGDPPSH